jgi:hypothetical protein
MEKHAERESGVTRAASAFGAPGSRTPRSRASISRSS